MAEQAPGTPAPVPVPAEVPVETPVIDPSPVAQSTDPATSGLIAFVIGSTAAMVVAGAAGGFWYRHSIAKSQR